MRWLLLVVVAACSAPARPVPVAGEPVVAAPPAIDAAVAMDAAWVADPALVAELQLIAKQRLDALHGERPDHDVEPVPGRDDVEERLLIPVLGTCARPSTEERAKLARRVEAWIKRRHPRARRVDGEIGNVSFGCVERDGIVIDAQADLETGRSRVGWWWTMRVTDAKIEVIEETSGCAVVDCMEWSDVASVQTLVLADLDGDGTRDPIIVRDRHEGGAARRLDVIVGKTVVGRVEGELSLPPLQPLPPTRAILVSVDAAYGEQVYRCITATGPWSYCPAAEEATLRVRQLAAAEALGASASAMLDDHDALADVLETLGVGDRERYLAAAAPSPLASEVRVFVKQRGAATAHLTVEEREAARLVAAQWHGAALLELLGHAPCPAADKAGEARIERWVDARHPDASRFTVLASCAGGAGAYWMVQWQLESAREPVAHRVLLHVRGGTITPLVEGTPPLEHDSDGMYPTDAYQLPEAKLHRQGSAIAALVRGPGDKLTAVIDGKVTGSRSVAADLGWNAFGDGGEMFEMTGDSLARSDDGELTTFWQATAAGPSPVAELPPITLTAPPAQTRPVAAWLERAERRRRAEAVVEVSPHPGQSQTELRAALDELRN